MADSTPRTTSPFVDTSAQTLLHSVAVPIITLDSNGAVTSWNPAAERLFGWNADEVLGRFNPLLTEEDRPFFEDALRQQLQGRPMQLELKRQTKSGVPLDVRLSATALYDDSGRVTGVVGVFEDLTERKRAEQTLAEQERFVSAVVANTPDYIIVFDLRSRDAVYRNRQMPVSLGYTADEACDLIPRILPALMHPEDLPRFESHLRSILEAPDDDVRSFEYRMRRKDGSYAWFLARDSVFKRDADGTPTQILSVMQEVTVQKQLDEELHRTRDRFERVFRSSPLCAMLFSLDTGEVLDVNDQFVRHHGPTREQALGRKVEDLGLWLDPAQRDRLMTSLRQGEPVEELEARLRGKSGDAVDALVRAQVLQLSSGPVVLTQAADVTEHRRMERLLRAQRDLALALDESPSLQKTVELCLGEAMSSLGMDAGGIYLVRPETGELELVHTAGLGEDFIAQTSRYAPDALQRLLVEDARPIFARSPDLDVGNRTMRDQEALRFLAMVPILHKGKPIGCLNLASRTVDDAPLHVREALETLAAQIGQAIVHQRAEEALRRSEEQLRTLFRCSPDRLLLLDRDHRIRMVNESTTGLPRGAMGSRLYEHLTPEDRPAVREALAELVVTARVQHFETSHPQPDGTTVHLSSIAAPVVVAGEVTGIVVSSRDVTERIRLEREKNDLEEQLWHAQKMEAVGRLAGGVAHDFNNVLCAILGNVALVLDDLPEADPLRGIMEEIATAGERASSLTRQLLTFSRKQIIEPKILDLGEVVKSLHPMLVRLLGEDIILRSESQRDLGRVRADPGQIEQVVVNLAVNARDAMPEGGTLLVETANVILDEDYCSKHVDAEPGNYVLLEVTDTGIGMDAWVRSKIFEPFFTTKGIGKGTGLGLATVYGIVAQSGGRIEVHSEPNRGSSFRVYFPRVHGEAARLDRVGRHLPGGKGETILVVEDEEVVRRMAVRVLERLGYNVLSARSAPEALALAANRQEPIALLLTDVVMPRMNGRELAEKLLESRPSLLVLYASGYTEDIVVQHGVVNGTVEFIAKPYSLDSLATRVREVLDRKIK